MQKQKNSKSIVYYSNNNLPHEFHKLCLNELRLAAGDIPIIAIVQKPLPIRIGHEIIVGSMPHCIASIYKQMLIGVSFASSDFIFFAEHDVIYTHQHFEFTPERSDQTMYYNKNVVVYNHGHSGFYKRPVLPISVGMGCREWISQNLQIRVKWAVEGGHSKDVGSTAIGKHGWEKSTGWKREFYRSPYPVVDVRTGRNFRNHGECFHDEQVEFNGSEYLWQRVSSSLVVEQQGKQH